jgi:hypothetical protein
VASGSWLCLLLIPIGYAITKYFWPTC